MLIFFASFFRSSYDSSSIRQLINQLHLVSLFSTCICYAHSFFILVFGIVCGYICFVFILYIYVIHLVMILVCVTYVEYSTASLDVLIAVIYVVSICALYICIFLLAFGCLFLSFSIFCQEYIWC